MSEFAPSENIGETQEPPDKFQALAIAWGCRQLTLKELKELVDIYDKIYNLTDEDPPEDEWGSRVAWGG